MRSNDRISVHDFRLDFDNGHNKQELGYVIELWKSVVVRGGSSIRPLSGKPLITARFTGTYPSRLIYVFLNHL